MIGLSLLLSKSDAHPLPNLRFDRTVHVRLASDAITVRYTLEINDWTMVLDGKEFLAPAEVKQISGPRDYATLYARKKAPILAELLLASVDERPLRWDVVSADSERVRDHLQFRFVFRADPGFRPGRNEFRFVDETFEDRSGAITLTIDNTDRRLELDEVEEPVDLRAKSPLDISPADARRLRLLSASVIVPSRVPPGESASSPAEPEPPISVAPSAPPSLRTDLAERGLSALFDTGYGLGVLLLLALGFGAAHAFTPGHGKTLVAAYLVGERGTIQHALVLGLVTTIAHTGSVLIVAIVLQQVYGDRVPAVTEAILKLLGGLLIFVVGLWLLLQRVRGRADHIHLFGDHHHHHGEHHHHHHGDRHPEPISGHDSVHSEPLPAQHRSFGWARVILLGLGGGIVPCWDAVLLLLVAVSAGRLGIAIPLLLAFSLGLASILVGLGIAVVYAHRLGGRRFGESRWFQRLPMISAGLLVLIGLWFARAGAQALTAITP